MHFSCLACVLHAHLSPPAPLHYPNNASWSVHITKLFSMQASPALSFFFLLSFLISFFSFLHTLSLSSFSVCGAFCLKNEQTNTKISVNTGLSHSCNKEIRRVHVMMVREKVKLSLCFNWAPRHEGVLGLWRYSSTHYDLGTRWRWVVSFTPRPLYHQGKSSWYPLDRRLGGPQKFH
jgi:hypothetical protein